MIRLTIKLVYPDQITFAIDGDIYTVAKVPKLKLFDHQREHGSQIPCPNFNEWLARRTTGFYQAHHLYAMAEAFQAGTALKVKPADLRKCATDIFKIVKESLFLDGIAWHYISRYPMANWSQADFRHNVLTNRTQLDTAMMHRICVNRGYYGLAEILEESLGKPEVKDEQAVSDVGDVAINTKIDKYLDGYSVRREK